MNTIDKKYQIFISSTYKDLILAREEVTKVILNMYHIPIGMEMFSADNEDQWDTIQETIDSSDYYILIIGHRYGSETKEGISYTEKEFEYAKATGVPIYTYIRNRDVPTLPSERDKEPEKVTKLEAFIEKAQNHSMVEFWKEPSDLGQKVSIAMPKAFRKKPRTGWVKGDQTASIKVLDELALLSKENRELKELLKTVNEQKPLIKVLFNGEERIDITIPKTFKTYKTLQRASYEYPENLYHLAHRFYTSQNVDRFNAWFDSNQETVKSFNMVTMSLERSKAHKKNYSISIVNEGYTKANDIFIEIIFPINLRIISKNDLKELDNWDWDYPEGAPFHPLVKAQTAYENLNKTKHPVDKSSTSTYGSINVSSIRSIHATSTFDILDNNRIEITLKSLLQTRKLEKDDDFQVYMLPLTPGDYIVTVKAICEELPNPQLIEIPISINESE